MRMRDHVGGPVQEISATFYVIEWLLFLTIGNVYEMSG